MFSFIIIAALISTLHSTPDTGSCEDVPQDPAEGSSMVQIRKHMVESKATDNITESLDTSTDNEYSASTDVSADTIEDSKQMVASMCRQAFANSAAYDPNTMYCYYREPTCGKLKVPGFNDEGRVKTLADARYFCSQCIGTHYGVQYPITKPDTATLPNTHSTVDTLTQCGLVKEEHYNVYKRRVTSIVDNQGNRRDDARIPAPGGGAWLHMINGQLGCVPNYQVVCNVKWSNSPSPPNPPKPTPPPATPAPTPAPIRYCHCSDKGGPSYFSAAMCPYLSRIGQCHRDWMKKACAKSCKVCSC